MGIGRQLLEALGEDPAREELAETPRRWAQFWQEFIAYEPGQVDTTFSAAESGQMVVVSGIKVWSVCEHHLLPFWCEIAIGYLSGDRVLGLSKFARIAQQHAHRPQVQERLVRDIADDVMRLTGSEDVAVMARGEHLCMLMRGVRTHGMMSSTTLRGRFYDEPLLRAEFLALAR